MPPTTQCAGVTTFIKTELIADGVGRAHVPRIGGAANGVTNGQRVDTELRKWIDNGNQGPLKHAGSRHVAAGLARMKIRPMKAQVRVTDTELKLTTLIDAVGEGPNGTLWVIEIKTTTLSSENHLKSYRRVCNRTPMMRNSVTHTEQATHYLQVAFGALTLRRMYKIHPDIPIMACVVVATADACRTYVCPDSFMDRKLFRRFAPVPLAARPKQRWTRRERKDDSLKTGTPGIAKWPERHGCVEKKIDRALLRLRLVRERRGMVKSVWNLYQVPKGKVKGRPVGVMAYITRDMHNLTRGQRGAIVSKLTCSARRLLRRYPDLSAAARLTVSAQSLAIAPCPGPLGRV